MVPQPLSWEEHFENFLANIEETHKLIESQRHQAPLQ
jgi:hypothetical protein